MEKILDWEIGKKLLRQYYRGDKNLIVEIVEGYLSIIYPIINKLKVEYNVSYESIYLKAVNELYNAIESYNLEKTAPFQIYAQTYIETFLEEKLRLCSDNDKIIKNNNLKLKK